MWHNLSNSHYLTDLLDIHNTSKYLMSQSWHVSQKAVAFHPVKSEKGVRSSCFWFSSHFGPCEISKPFKKSTRRWLQFPGCFTVLRHPANVPVDQHGNEPVFWAENPLCFLEGSCQFWGKQLSSILCWWLRRHQFQKKNMVLVAQHERIFNFCCSAPVFWLELCLSRNLLILAIFGHVKS